MPAAGGEARRLTFHSADDTPDQLHARRQGRPLQLGPARQRRERPVPHRRAARALLASPCAGGMPAPGADDAGPLRRLRPGRQAPRLLGPEGLRDGVAQARQLLLRPRRLGLGRAPATSTAASPPPAPTTASRSGRPTSAALYYLSEQSGSFNVWRLELADPDAPGPGDDPHGPPRALPEQLSRPRRPLLRLRRRDLGAPGGRAESRKLEVTAAADRATTSPSRRSTSRARSASSSSRRTARRSPSSRAARSSSPRSSTARPAASPTRPSRSAR